MLKKIPYFFLPLFVSIGVELLFFNFDVVQLRMASAQMRVYHLEDFQYQNWEKNDAFMISGLDPMLYIDDVDMDIYSLDIHIQATPMPVQCTFFYTNETGEVFSAEKMQFLPITDGNASISFPEGEEIIAFRLDLGEDAGIALDSISAIVNDTSWHVSIARLVAMLVIYWGAKGLMGLQKSPDYGLGTKNQEKHTDES